MVGDTSAFTRVVSSPAIPSLSTQLASNSPYYSPASLKFSCRVNASFISIASHTWDIRTGRSQNASVADAVEKADGGDTITLEGVGAEGYGCVGENCPVGTSVRVAINVVDNLVRSLNSDTVSEGLFSRALRVLRTHRRTRPHRPHHHIHCSQAIPGQVPLLTFHDTIR
ncbi:hypothetical protein BGW80DRAFT_1295431 [Lactifluus volemus]|nr:hypothetical protein BGW80DRAFT_1295431 [Lactifluus volemus]